MRSGSTAKVLAKCKLKYYRISECSARWVNKAQALQSDCYLSAAATHSKAPRSNLLLSAHLDSTVYPWILTTLKRHARRVLVDGLDRLIYPSCLGSMRNVCLLLSYLSPKLFKPDGTTIRCHWWVYSDNCSIGTLLVHGSFPVALRPQCHQRI